MAKDCCCLLKFLLKQAFGFLTFYLAIRTVNWIIQVKSETRPHVSTARLIAFDTSHDGNSMLSYDIFLDIQFYQKHVSLGGRNGHLRAAVYYAGAKVGPTDDTLPPFNQRSHDIKLVRQEVKGQAAVQSAAVADALVRDKAKGFFEHMELRVRFAKTLYTGGHVYAYRYSCPLRFPVPKGGADPAVLTGVQCRRRWGW